MNLNWRIPLALTMVWLTVSLGAVLPTASLDFSSPVSSNPPPVVVPPPSESSGGGNYLFYFLQISVFAIIVLGIVGAFVYRRQALSEALHTAISLALYLLFLGGLYVLANKVSIILHGSSEYPGTPGSTPQYSGDALTLTAISIFMAIVVAVFLLKVYGRPKKRVVRPKAVTAGESVERAIYQARIGKDVRGAILSAYKEMENLMRASGVSSKDYFTPREFREFALEKLKISEEPVDTLTQLFELARYSRHEMNEEHRRRAIEALEAIRNEIE